MITELTRMWLTRSTKPFLFKNEYDQELPFSDCDGLGLYVHIPFCRSICSFCPYCKTLYSTWQEAKFPEKRPSPACTSAAALRPWRRTA